MLRRQLPIVLASLASAAVWSTASTVSAADYYVSGDGTDPLQCEGGTSTAPWRTWTVPRTQGCIQPGDTVFFSAGVYESGTGVFDSGDSKSIRFAGESGAPIRLARDPQASGDWPVTFRGSFTASGQWGIIEGIEIEGDGSGNVLMVNASHLTLSGCLVRGRVADVDPEDSGNYDCVKILAGHPTQLEDIQVLDSTIRDCPEDAIDVTGARDLVYRNNHIHNSWVIQVKGGTENIVIERNLIHDVRNGINGAGMGIDMGSVIIPTLPVADRFVAKNVVVRNNVIYGVEKWVALGAHGWQNAEIYHNTLANLASNALIVGSAGFDTTDPLAAAYCSANTCDSCAHNEPNCWHIDFAARDVKFKNNIVVASGGSAIRAYSHALEGFEAASNIYYAPSSEVTFRLDGTNYRLADFPHESGSWEVDPGFMDLANHDYALTVSSEAIDKGEDLGVPADFLGNPRDTSPDVGAYEYVRPGAGGGGGGAGGSNPDGAAGATIDGGAGIGGASAGGGSATIPAAPAGDDGGCGCRVKASGRGRDKPMGWLLLWALEPEGSQGPAQGVRREPEDQQPEGPRAGAYPGGSFIATDATHLYWKQSSTFVRAPKDGGGTVEDIVFVGTGPHVFAVDGTELVYGYDDRILLYRVSTSPPFARVQLNPTRLDATFVAGPIMDSGHAYVMDLPYQDIATIYRIPRSGGEAEVFVGDQPSGRALAQDATHIYWTALHGGKHLILRKAK